MKLKNIIIIAIILLAAVLLYLQFGAQHVEELGQLKLTTHDTNKKYCIYQVTGATPEDMRAYQNGDKVCIECRDDWPNVEVGGNKQCYSRVTFVSDSGYVTYEMKLYSKDVKICDSCTDGKGYYEGPK